MEILKNHSLKKYNTFAVEAKAAQYVVAQDVMALSQWLASTPKPRKVLVLGGGSNLLFTRNFNGLVIRNAIDGIHVVRDDDRYIWVKAGGGVRWHHLVDSCIRAGFSGLENLSLIPGTVGAAPVQNIGAYGVELCEVMEALEAYHLKTGTRRYFRNSDCQFSYRNSIFKHELKGQYIITNVVFRLSKKPEFNISYGALRDVIGSMHVDDLTPRIVSDAVIRIRSAKLPDPEKLGNAGSFFKNPVIDQKDFEGLKIRFPDLTGYPVETGKIKISAGWLIEQCGWKGKSMGMAGVYEHQALVLVNRGTQDGREISRLAGKVRQSVQDRFGIVLDPEVTIL
jgi:UDP-N-acetylmuramate dehydrogenase